MKPLNIHTLLWPALYAMCSLAACTGVTGNNATPPLANSCREGSHMQDGECKANRTTEDCSQLDDLDHDGLVPSLDCQDCPALCGLLPDGGAADGGQGQHNDAGMVVADTCTKFCYLVSPVLYEEADGGRKYYFPSQGNGARVPLPTGPGISNAEVGLPTPRAVKVCYTLGNDKDGDGIANQQDNCWMEANPPPPCTSNAGCVNAGDICQSGRCIKQLDSDLDGVGDACDPNPGENDGEWAKYCDPDPDDDAIPYWEDGCKETGTTLEENVQDADKDGMPNVCDPCAYPEMSCQHG